jgi:hypothetical protein
VQTTTTQVERKKGFLDHLNKTNRINVVGPCEIALPQGDALARLKDQGFVPTAYRVCSGSVSTDRVRQVVQKTAGREVVLVDKSGVTQAGRGLQKSATIEIKVSTGVPCTR